MWFIEYVFEVDNIYHEGECQNSRDCKNDYMYENYIICNTLVQATKELVSLYIENDGVLNAEGKKYFSSETRCGCSGCRKIIKVVSGKLIYTDKNIKEIFLDNSYRGIIREKYYFY